MNLEPGIVGALLENEVNGESPFLVQLLNHAPESFDDQRAGQIAAEIRRCRSEGRPVYVPAIIASVTFDNALTFIEGCRKDPMTIGQAEYEAKPLWNKYLSRQTAKLLDEIPRDLLADPEHGAKHRARLISELQRLDAEQGSDGLTIRTPDEILAMTFDDGDRMLGDRLLATGQSLVIAGQGGLGKSRLLLQFIAAQRAGLPFVGFETRQQEMTWLVLQAENSNRRLQQDLASLRAWIGEQHWPRVQAGLHIHTLENDCDNFLSLDDERTQARIRQLIASIKPDGVAWDSLFNFGVGNLSSDEDMTATLLPIARLSKAGNPDRAIVVLHHALTGKAGASRATGFDRTSFGRNSKVLFQWTRGQINISPGSPDSNELLVLSCGKCSNGKEFPTFAIRLDPETMLYSVDESFDLAAWQSEVTGKKETILTVERVGELCKGAMSKKALAAAIMDDAGCVKQYAYRMIQKAERGRQIIYSKTSENYVRKP